MTRCSIEPRTIKYLKGHGFLSFGRNLFNKYGKQLSDAATKAGVDAVKIVSKNVVYEAVEARGEFIGNKVANKIVKPKPVSKENSRNVEKIVFTPDKRRNIQRIKTLRH